MAALATALLALHARHFDFVCDDAFIALRQAQNLAFHGAPVYNLGEPVEVATSPAWAVLLAVGLRLRVPPVALLQGLALVAGALLVFATSSLARRVLPARPAAQACVLLALVATAPVAAWSSGGLEAPLFAAGLTFALSRLDALDRAGTRRAALRLGVALGLACLVRLEALLLVGLIAAVLVAQRRHALAQLARVLGVALAPVVALTAFRLAYYGLPLPHTYYAKTADLWDEAMIRHGVGYARFAVDDLGAVQTALLVASPFLAPAARAPAFVWVARLFVPAYVAYVVLVGGDFLDLYRFLLPLFPVTFVAFAAVCLALLERFATRPTARLAFAAMVLAPHLIRQLALSRRALEITDARRTDVGIEPLGWTKMAAGTWSSVGRWLATVAEPGDTLGTSAAGAMPFFSGLPNFDLLGLAAPDVVREGAPLWVRPGHTRVATPALIARHAPTFLFVEGTGGWARGAYDEVLVHLADGSTTKLLVRRDRVARLLVRRDVERVAAR